MAEGARLESPVVRFLGLALVLSVFQILTVNPQAENDNTDCQSVRHFEANSNWSFPLTRRDRMRPHVEAHIRVVSGSASRAFCTTFFVSVQAHLTKNISPTEVVDCVFG